MITKIKIAVDFESTCDTGFGSFQIRAEKNSSVDETALGPTVAAIVEAEMRRVAGISRKDHEALRLKLADAERRIDLLSVVPPPPPAADEVLADAVLESSPRRGRPRKVREE